MSIESAYIHIPFCEQICSYCDFCKLLYNENLVNKYLNKLKEEILSTYKGEKLKTIYIGGGTPSSLTIPQLNKLFDIIDIFNKENIYELTIECNFENTPEEKLELFKKRGVNRLSFGIESTDKKQLALLNRKLNKTHTKDIINYAKSIGIDNINVDLIYALPKQNINDLKIDLDFILSLGIKHISTYSLIIENHTLLSIKNIQNISQETDSEMYKFICSYLKKHEFNHYEISNFSKKGYESNHNLTYWNNLEYYGFGLGASSYIGNKRYSNTKSYTKYIKNIYLGDIEYLTEKDTIEYEIMLNLRTSKGISKETFYKKFNKNIESCYNYNNLILQGFLKEKDNYIYIPEDKWYISNEIIVRFLEGEKYE